MSMQQIDNLMKQAVAEGVFPGAVLLLSHNAAVGSLKAYGLAHLYDKVPVAPETIFDLASLTKPLATTLAVMRLVQHRKIRLEQPLGDLLPEFQDSDKAQVRIKHLLYHTSGLPDYRPYYKALSRLAPDQRRTALRQFLLREPPIQPIGSEVLYSDLGFMILAWVVEHVSAQRLDHFVADEIYQPLGLKNLFFNPRNTVNRRKSFAATENCPWRRKILVGQVHDENAFAAGGIEGHAGLFGTAEDVHTLLAELLCSYHRQVRARLFSPEVLHQFFQRLPGTDKAMGFDMPLPEGASCGRNFSPNSVGHLGFTGTSFWMDLERRVIVILLTNRVHPTRENEAIKAFRPLLHDTLMQTKGYKIF